MRHTYLEPFVCYNLHVTTLVIHPQFSTQKTVAFQLAEKLIGTAIKLDNLHPDIHMIDGSIVSSIGIDEIRELIRKLQYQPYCAEVQLGIILCANALTPEAQNSLLKNLEEPGPQTCFILTTSHEKFMLPTIISRSQKIYVDQELNTKIEEAETDGNSKLDEFLKLPLVDKFLWIEKLAAGEKENKGGVKAFLIELVKRYRTQLVTQTATRDPQMSQTAGDVRKINKALHFISRNANKRLTLENLILQLDHGQKTGG